MSGGIEGLDSSAQPYSGEPRGDQVSTDQMLMDLRAELAQERQSRKQAVEIAERLKLLCDGWSQLSGSLDTDQLISRLCDLVVPRLADWMILRLNDQEGRTERVATRHRAGRSDLLDTYQRGIDQGLSDLAPSRKVLAGDGGSVLSSINLENLEALVPDPTLRQVILELGVGSTLSVPIFARRRERIGTLTLVSSSSQRPYGPRDLELVLELVREAGLVLDNVKILEREREISQELQRSMLPALPDIEGLEVAVGYRPVDRSSQIGGDLCSVQRLSDGSCGVAVGDVAGHDLAAAARMGHLLGMVRAAAWESMSQDGGDPAAVLERVDRIVQGLQLVPLATLIYGRLEPLAGESQSWLLRLATAGHPPPILRTPDGQVSVVKTTPGVLLGVSEDGKRPTAELRLEAGSVLLFYTDGLIERRGEDIDRGTERLVEILRSYRQDRIAGPLSELVGDILFFSREQRADDVSVLAIRVGGSGTVVI